MSVVAGVDVGNATTEVVLVSGGTILGYGRVPTRGRKGSVDSLRAAAALVRRLERQAGRSVTEARIAPLRAVGTSLVTVPEIAPATGRLRLLAADVPTPGVAGVCIGRPLLLTSVRTPDAAARGAGSSAGGPAPFPGACATTAPPSDGVPVVALVPLAVGYEQAARLLGGLTADGVRIGAVLVAGDEGVLIANRVSAAGAVIDQVDIVAASACELLAIEVRPPGRSLRLLSDPVALTVAFGLGDEDAAYATALCRTLTDYSNAVVGMLRVPGQTAPDTDEPWVSMADGGRMPLRTACVLIPDWVPGTVRALDEARVDDLFAVDLAVAAEAATARQGSVGRAVLVASLTAADEAGTPADRLAGLLDVPVSSPLTEPDAARLGALTTPGARADALVVDLGAGTIDVVDGGASVVAAGAGELLTVAVAELLGIPRAAADWVKRGPCIRVDGGLRYEAEDGTRGFLDAPAPSSAAGMLAVSGPGGWLPFSRRHGPGEWRAIRLRIKQHVLSKNLRRAMRGAGADPSQILVVGGPAEDEELLAVIARTTADGVPIGRGNVGGTLGPRYAVALGLGLALAG
jgi:hypothetical protein